MLYIYIGAVLIAALLIGFVTLSVIWVTQKVSSNIREKAAELISGYDEIIEERSRVLGEINSEVDRLKAEREQLSDEIERARDPEAASRSTEAAGLSATALLNAAEQLGSSEYTPSNTGEIYNKIRKNFRYSPYDAIRELVSGAGLEGPAAALLRELNYDTVYRLSVLSESEQLSVLSEALDENGAALVEKYLQGHRHFQAIEFYDWLSEEAANEPGSVRLRLSPNERERAYPRGVEVITDPEILEGFQIEVNNRLYDYCVKKREIG